jgi:FKBP-type peptidyl-prolyl cis-trans isomerase SlyD
MSAEMTIEKDRVVHFHYTVRDDGGEILETTEGRQPQPILYGHGSVPKGIEEALAGHVSGDQVAVRLAPEEAYGERRENWTKRVSKKHLPRTGRLRPGMTVRLQTEQGPRTVTVVKVGHTVVDVDLNHPLAGRALNFELSVIDVREASPEEIAHGHVHGPGGHQH